MHPPTGGGQRELNPGCRFFLFRIKFFVFNFKGVSMKILRNELEGTRLEIYEYGESFDGSMILILLKLIKLISNANTKSSLNDLHLFKNVINEEDKNYSLKHDFQMIYSLFDLKILLIVLGIIEIDAHDGDLVATKLFHKLKNYLKSEEFKNHLDSLDDNYLVQIGLIKNLT